MYIYIYTYIYIYIVPSLASVFVHSQIIEYMHTAFVACIILLKLFIFVRNTRILYTIHNMKYAHPQLSELIVAAPQLTGCSGHHHHYHNYYHWHRNNDICCYIPTL